MNISEETASGDAALHTFMPEDVTLVFCSLQGDEHAFERIIQRYNRRLYRLAVSVVGDAVEALDLLQESYVRAFSSLATFNGESLGGWLARIVRNEAIDRFWERISRSDAVILDASMLRRSDAQAIFASDIATSEQDFDPEKIVARTSGLERAVESLPTRYRTVFAMRELEGLTLNETAEYLGISVATVKTRDTRGRALLREKLGDRIDVATSEAFSFSGEQCNALVENVLKRIHH